MNLNGISPDVNIDIESALPPDEEDATRQRILDSARELYVEFGLRRTTMEDVAKKAGMGRATVYRRFSEKDQLFQAVILRDLQRNLVIIEGAIRGYSSALDGLLEAFVQAARLVHINPLIARLLTTEPDDILPHLTTQYGSTMAFARQYLSGQIARAQQAGHIRKSLPADTTAELILRLIQSVALTPEGVINPANEASVRDFANLFLRPLLAP